MGGGVTAYLTVVAFQRLKRLIQNDPPSQKQKKTGEDVVEKARRWPAATPALTPADAQPTAQAPGLQGPEAFLRFSKLDTMLIIRDIFMSSIPKNRQI